MTTDTNFRIAIDCSNYTDHVSDAWDSWISDHNVRLLLPQSLDPPAGYPSGRTVEQVDWALSRRLLCAPYVWKWWGVDDIQRRLDVISAYTGQLDHLWLDVEDTSIGTLGGARVMVPPGALERLRRQPRPELQGRMVRALARAESLQQRIDEISAALEIMDQFPTKSGMPTGIYTGGWFWAPYMGATTVFSNRALWPSEYDGIVDPAVWTTFGGWATCCLKQFQGTSTYNGVAGVDLSVLGIDYLVDKPPVDPQQRIADLTNALSDVTQPGGEIVQALQAAMKLTNVKSMRPSVQDVVNRLGAIGQQFLT